MRSVNSCLVFLVINSASAQPFNWQWSVHDTLSYDPPVKGFATDALGNSYVAGSFQGTASFGTLPPITSAGIEDVYVTKYNNQGVALWSVRAGGTNVDRCFDLAIDDLGGVFITGEFGSSDADFGTTTLSVANWTDMFVAKLNASDGSFVWARRYGENSATEWGKALACDQSGNVYITGMFSTYLAVPGLATLSQCQYDNSFLLKLDPNGNGVWSRRPDCELQAPIGQGQGQCLALSSAGDLYLGMRFRGDIIYFESDTLLNTATDGGSRDIVFAKYDLDGNYAWSRSIGSLGNDDVQAMDAASNGDLYVAIHREGDTFVPGITDDISFIGSTGAYRNVVLKLSAQGDFIWGERCGNSTMDHDITGLKLDATGHLFFGGWYGWDLELGGVEVLPGMPGIGGQYVARFDTSHVMQAFHSSFSSHSVRVLGLDVDQESNMYVVGKFQDSLSFPGLPPMEVNGRSIFLARTDVIDAGFAPEPDEDDGAVIYPMPAADRFTLAFNVPFKEVRICDVEGRSVLHEAFPPTTQRRMVLDADGMYFYSIITCDGRMVNGPLVVQH